jgi:hypothetical protein
LNVAVCVGGLVRVSTRASPSVVIVYEPVPIAVQLRDEPLLKRSLQA